MKKWKTLNKILMSFLRFAGMQFPLHCVYKHSFRTPSPHPFRTHFGIIQHLVPVHTSIDRVSFSSSFLGIFPVLWRCHILIEPRTANRMQKNSNGKVRIHVHLWWRRGVNDIEEEMNECRVVLREFSNNPLKIWNNRHSHN